MASALRNAAKRVGVAVLGGGRMGEIRTQVLYANPNFALRAVADADATIADALSAKYQAVRSQPRPRYKLIS